MGYTGLMADSIVEMNVVTANGSEVTVSQSSNPDLFWAMRGAGHNFGVVTKLKYGIMDYPKGPSTYHATYIFAEDKLEAMFKQLNKLGDNGKMPKDINTFVVLALDTATSKVDREFQCRCGLDNSDKEQPLFACNILYFGTAAQALPYFKPFLDLGPVSVINGSTLYKDLAHEVYKSAPGQALCLAGSTKHLVPVGLQTYNATANRQIYNLFAEMVTTAPSFNGSYVQFEGYAIEGVKAVDPASTAYPHREDNLLVLVIANPKWTSNYHLIFLVLGLFLSNTHPQQPTMLRH